MAEDLVRDARVREGQAGQDVCFFKSAGKFDSKEYTTYGFEEAANLDDGAMWPTSYALKELTAADGRSSARSVKKAASSTPSFAIAPAVGYVR